MVIESLGALYKPGTRISGSHMNLVIESLGTLPLYKYGYRISGGPYINLVIESPGTLSLYKPGNRISGGPYMKLAIESLGPYINPVI